MAYKIQLRRDLALRWSDNNPVLLLGEFGYEYDTGYAKIGDGQSPWADLTYFVGGTGSRGDTLVSLIDTPAEYTGAEEYYLRVNKIGNGVEFVPIATINAEIDLRGATGYEPTDAGRYLRVKPDGSGFEWYTVTGGTGGGAFLNISPTLADASGYDAGTSFENVLLDKMWGGLLYPEEQANYKLVYVAAYPGGTAASSYDVLEVGQSMDVTLNFGWENNNEILFKPSTVSIYDIDNSLDIAIDIDETSSPEVYTYASAITKTTKASHNWKWTAMDVNEVVFNKAYRVNWYYPIATGRSSGITLTNAQVAALPRLPQADSTGNYSFAASDDYIYICLPNGGTDYDIKGMTVNGMPLELADVDDGYTDIDSAGISYDSVSSVNINSVITTYRVYRSKHKINEALTVSISSIDLATGLKLTGMIQPVSETEVYPITDPQYGIDGLRNVDDLTAMYVIPQPRRKLGMLVGVGITGNVGGYYKLTNEPGTLNTTVSDWSMFNSAVVTYGSTGATGIIGATGFNIEPGVRLTIELVESPVGVANYTVDIPELISGGTA